MNEPASPQDTAIPPPPKTYTETLTRLWETRPSEMLAIDAVERTLALFDMFPSSFSIDAFMIHTLFQIKEPFGLWAKRKLTHFKPYKDYVRVTASAGEGTVIKDCNIQDAAGGASPGPATPGKRRRHKRQTQILVTVDTARVMMMGNSGMVGAVYSVLTSARLCEVFKGRDIIGMFKDAQKWSAENERLEGLFDE